MTTEPPPPTLLCGSCGKEYPAESVVCKQCGVCGGWICRCTACGGPDALVDAFAVHINRQHIDTRDLDEPGAPGDA